METVFIDECGFTGQDLLNPDQPYFVLASLHFDEKIASDLKQEFFGGVQATELKFKRLRKNRSRQVMVEKFVEHLMSQPPLFKISITNKAFALLCKMVDLLVEPAMYKTGFNAYKDGFNLALSNLLWNVTPMLHGEEFFQRLIHKFQALAQQRTAEAFESFFDLLDGKDLHRDPLEFVVVSKTLLTVDDLPFGKMHPLDVTTTSFLSIISHWRSLISTELHVMHDESMKLMKVEEIWRKLTDTTPAETVVQTMLGAMTLPIKVEKITFEDSSQFAGLQLTDVFAGVVASYAKWMSKEKRSNDPFLMKLDKLMHDNLGGFAILPSTKVTPQDLGAVGFDGNESLGVIQKLLQR